MPNAEKAGWVMESVKRGLDEKSAGMGFSEIFILSTRNKYTLQDIDSAR